MHYTDDNVSVSPLSLYSSYEQIDIELRTPHSMPVSHWHGQIEMNIPFGDDIDYIINGETVTIRNGHVGLFWASVPHRLTDAGNSHNMGIINIPIHIFLSWPLSRELINQVTHGVVLQSDSSCLVSEFEIQRWERETKLPDANRRQLSADEICLMLKRICLDGWSSLLNGHAERANQNGVSKHSQFYVSQMLEYIASHHDTPLTVNQIASHVGLHANYAMGLFQRVMQMTIKQYITAMRVNHARALLSDTERTILDISLTVGFNSSSRFYQTFQTYPGVTPKQYRNLSRNNQKRG
ncbi:transcriptional regulator, AraC family [Enterovibrio nigricans DSM 22720]|uniref:Transcriptional regulator, AraC family n=2 Tax=Enterovibrio nigricans TaxID=504469 RepID=A0A1T4VB55_9GAMM|nr:transcriptional regulator, AraC family [Enterovibrio nigricans DSM 22720]